MSLPGHPRGPYDVAMLQSTTRQGTDYGAQGDLEGEGVLNDSGNRGPEHRTLRKDPESDVGPSAPRSRSSSRESKFSGSMGSPKGSPVSGKKLRKELITEDIKREDDRDYARFKFLGGLKELGRMAPTTTEAVVAVANGPGLYKALLLDMGVPKDSIEKVMQIYLSCYGHFLTKDEGKDDREKAEFLVSTLKGDSFKAIMYAQRIHGELSFQEICRRLERRYEGDFSSPASAWIKLDQAVQQQTESLYQWSDRLNKIGDSIFRLDVGGRKSLEPRLISKFCFAAWDRDAGFKAMEHGPPTTLEAAVESVRWYQHVKGAVDNSYAERPRANVRGWSPEREKLDRRDQYQGRRDDGDSRFDRYRDQYQSRRDDGDSRFDRYRGNSRAAQSQSTYRARSPEFVGYEGSASRAEDARDREWDSRDKYQVRAVSGGLEAAVAELTKQVGGLTQEFRGLTQEVRGMKGRLDSIDTRLAKVEAWESRLDAVE